MFVYFYTWYRLVTDRQTDGRRRLYLSRGTLSCWRNCADSAEQTKRTRQNIRNHSLRSSDIKTCTVPRTFTRFSDSRFPVSRRRVRNDWSVALRAPDVTFNCFKRMLHMFLFTLVWWGLVADYWCLEIAYVVVPYN